MNAPTSNFYADALSISDACEMAGVGRTTIYAAIAEGRLKARKLGRRTLISSSFAMMKKWPARARIVTRRLSHRARSPKDRGPRCF